MIRPAAGSLSNYEQDGTVVAVIEISQSSWLMAGIVPGLERHPLKKLEADQDAPEASGAMREHLIAAQRRLGG